MLLKTTMTETAVWYESILNSIPVPIAVTDNDMRWTFLNKAALTLLGQPSGSLIGKPCHTWNSPVCNTEECGIARLRKNPAMLTAHSVFIHNDRVFSVDCAFLTDNHNKHIGHITFMRDITEDTKLRMAAEAASQAKSEFLSTISHEIRTPMNAIVGLLHLFERGNLTLAQEDSLDKIRCAADTLLQIINDVLDITTIEKGYLELEQAPFLLSRVLDAVRATLGDEAQGKGLTLTITRADTVPQYLYGDAKRLRQVLLNLVSNAIKFTEQGMVRVSVAVDSTTLIFSVSDSGIGITEAQMERLFMPFAQADASMSRRYGGTGLGLYLCKQLVELMGGSISATSQPVSQGGRGSTFRFAVPLTLADADSVDRGAVPVRCTNKSVLVVEDNEINQEIALALLERHGLVVDMVNNGQEALDTVVTARYDCIFMDMQMPVMDGLEATRRLRTLGAEQDTALRWLGRVPIIAMTANAMTHDSQRCLDAGMNDHISKPIDPLVLQRCLKKWLVECAG